MVKVLILVGHYLPGYKSGGSLRSIVNLVENLGEEFDFWIITSDRDFGDEIPYQNVSIDEWNIIGNARVYYISSERCSTTNIENLINETPYDILYLNSFFDPVFTIRPLFSRLLRRLSNQPTIIAPRGEFSEGAIMLKKYKKLVYIYIAKVIGLYKNLIWQASNNFELKDIHRIVGKYASNIIVAPDVLQCFKPLINNNTYHYRNKKEPLKICFLSRISPIKNLDYALQVLIKVRVPITFDIYGPKEDEDYWVLCKSIIKMLPLCVKVNYKRCVENHEVNDIFRDYDLFFFPTKGENFGHVIMESLIAGTPILIANTTPWRNLESIGIGWDLPLESPDTFVAVIEKIAALNETDYVELRNCVQRYAETVCNDKHILNANRQLFMDVVKNGV